MESRKKTHMKLKKGLRGDMESDEWRLSTKTR